MYAIVGITGQVGGATARTLLAQGHRVRAVVRSAAKGEPWAQRNAEVAVADVLDTPALERAFRGVDGVFVMSPPNFAPSPGFPELREVTDSIGRALAAAAPPKIVFLSSIGAQHSHGLGLIHGSHFCEQAFGRLRLPVAFLRAGWFMENSAWDAPSAVRTGEISSFLQPLDRAFPMVATEDIGRVAAETLLETWDDQRIIELEGPRRYTQHDLATAFGVALGRRVVAKAVPRETWTSLFQSQGNPWPEPRIEMLDGFNSGWIEFAKNGTEHRFGRIAFESVARELLHHTA